VLVD